jgi:hypothetical protein
MYCGLHFQFRCAGEIPSIKSCDVFSDVGNANVARCDDNSVGDSSHRHTRLF